MLESINIHSEIPVYEQIENTVMFAITSGKLGADDQLPSVKELAERVGINPNTVAKAYRDLEVMGLIYTRRGMGCFIDKGVQVACRAKVFTRITNRFFEVGREGLCAGMSQGQILSVLSATSESGDVGSYSEVPDFVLKAGKPGKVFVASTRQTQMLESINIHSEVAVYAQIENEVQFAIAIGGLQASDQLPTVRELSERLDLNPNTVAKAYRDLEVMGLLYTRRGMGVYTNKGVQAKCRTKCFRRTATRLFELGREAMEADMSRGQIESILTAVGNVDNVGPYGEPPAAVLKAGKPDKK